MASRQDQLHSYQFMMQRVVAALVMRDTDPTRSPFRRAAGATLASVLVAAIAIGAVGVISLLTGGGAATSWRDDGAVIVEKETGARFVWQGGRLHPVRNYTSALLVIGAPADKVDVSRRSLDGAPRGPELGIAGAPDSLPPADQLLTGPWSLCSGPVTGSGTGPATRSVLLVGATREGGRAMDEEALLVRDPGGVWYLVWQQRRHRIWDSSAVLAALGWVGRQPVPVATALVNGIEAGPDLALINIPGRGEESPVVPGATVGEVFVVESQDGERQYAIALREGLAPLTQVQKDLVLADPRTAQMVRQDAPTPLTPAELAELPRMLPADAVEGTALPATPPPLAAADDVICALVADGGDTAIVAGGTLPALDDAVRTPGRSAEDTLLVDYLVVPPGRGVVVEAVATRTAEGGTVSLVTDAGTRYAVPGAQVQAALGYADVAPVRVPASLVSLVPEGPALDPEQAREPDGSW